MSADDDVDTILLYFGVPVRAQLLGTVLIALSSADPAAVVEDDDGVFQVRMRLSGSDR